ncbi:Rhamnolipids biosynthesis 3-oxoacyl-[acyl-carrier-protein] reductase [Wickerhamiella sorbophila]|uniref:Rhamnolipids biosynthesis 3-oxoacyl-[acyl-carrier-protein] reductase n=1 Tax=Wickerhamiella sorbophila TaxID=45607 RepID=A0A2T0FHW7_9ASCO|nr:Rhamnolipids biosynthesis 3-oxoacyl-[acyl-carrier-protein] reductase [Wickerhamiella sorbophila]PRT54592.1 Rhamnolipids biosynthesis 3-oxoacyl-[acyl-carrier-protein] reductase [Wickerhamiella sorbophila]
MSSELFKVNNKIALITGGSRGLGLDMAEGLLLAGASKIYISSRKASACDESVKYLSDLAKKHNLRCEAIAIPADLGSRAGCEALAKEFVKREQKLDILIANAGATWGADFDSHPDEAIGKVLDLNVRGVFSTIQLFAPFLRKAGTSEDPSRVLITGSIAGIRAVSSGGTYGYLASKAAVHHLGRSLASELGPENITVNILAPGFFPSKMSNGVLSVIGKELTETNPRRRLGVKQDIIGTTVFLCSPAGNYINGVVLPIDGGASVSKL